VEKVSVTQKGDLQGYGIIRMELLTSYTYTTYRKDTESLFTAPMVLGSQCIRKTVVFMYSNPPKRGYSSLILNVT